MLAAAYNCLSEHGRFMLTTQFRNSHFKKWENDPMAMRHLDGFIVNGRRGASFYGMIDAVALQRICVHNGFKIEDAGHVDELAYVLARR
jgi:hypothetical protein